jgi:hypothetical protein
MKKTLLSFLSIVSLTIMLGCGAGSLQQGGAYSPVDTNGVALVQPDLQFYQADAAFDLAYATIDAAFKFEFDNRALLWKTSPQIKRALDGVRPQATAAFIEWGKARQVYLLNPVPANLTVLQQILAKVQQLTLTAQSTLPK